MLSLESQTYLPTEIVVVDDCSPEGAEIRQVLQRHPQVRYMRNASNFGLAGARNEGLSQVTGDIVTFMDADDEAHPQRFEFQIRHVGLRRVVACDVEIVCAGEATPDFRYFSKCPIKVYQSPGQIVYFNRLTGASLMAPTALLKEFGGYDKTLRSCEDFDLWLRLLAGGVVVHRVQLPLYVYHQNPRGLSKDYLSIGRWELEVVGRLAHTGWIGEPTSLKVGTVWAMWITRQYIRSEKAGDPELVRLADAQLNELASWPFLKRIVQVLVASRLIGLSRYI